MTGELNRDYPPHVQRMIEEGDALNDKIQKLGKFLTEQKVPLAATDFSLMQAQLGVMTAYLSILTIRLDRAQAE